MTLDQWRNAQKLTFDGLAALLRCSRSTAFRLCKGMRLPDRDQMTAILEVTNRAVTPNDFYSDAVAPAPSAEAATANA